MLLVDLFPPAHDPQGMHGAIWQQINEGGETYELPPDSRLTSASYLADREVEAYVEHFAVGGTLVDMPLFLNPERYVYAPLNVAYETAFRGLPLVWREVLEAG